MEKKQEKSKKIKTTEKIVTKKNYKWLKISGLVIGIIGLLILSFYISTKNNIDYSSYVIDTNKDTYFEYYNGSEAKVILLASENCSWCKLYMPIIRTVAYKNNIAINYVNLESLTSADYELIHDSVPSLNGVVDSNGNSVIPTPYTVIVSNGKVVAYLEGKVEEKELVTFLQKNNIIA